MERLDVAEGFDVHDYRHGLKLLTQERETMTLENREPFACPACGERFDRLFISEQRTNSFDDPGRPFCLARTDDSLLVFTH
jgi:hypothetical protein